MKFSIRITKVVVILLSVFGVACSPMQSHTDSSSSTVASNGDGENPASTPVATPAPSPFPMPPAPSPVPGPAPAPKPGCGLQTNTSPVAFCETFDNPYPVTGRSGQLNPVLWGASRWSGDINFGRPFSWANTSLDLCGRMVDGTAPNDIQICNGQLRDSVNDNISGGFEEGGVVALTMYAKQPFDFSGRTGTIGFDVSNDSAGTHAAWPEFWLTDQPTPTPFLHFGSDTAPTNSFGIRFAASTPPGQFCGGKVENTYRFTVDSASISRDWIVEDDMCDFTGPNSSCIHGQMSVKILDCVRQASGPNDGLNHVELKVSQNQIDVYASDAGSTTLKRIAVIENANLTFTRGFVWIEHVHYNADKGDPNRPSQRIHTFAWDNVAFDGPVVARDLSFDVPDSLSPIANGHVIGWEALPTKPAKLTTLPIGAADLVSAKTASLLFISYHQTTPKTFTYVINGHVHNATWPFPDRNGFAIKTLSLPIPLTDLVMGPNQITIYADQVIEVANVNISLAGAGGIVNPIVK